MHTQESSNLLLLRIQGDIVTLSENKAVSHKLYITLPFGSGLLPWFLHKWMGKIVQFRSLHTSFIYNQQRLEAT